MAKYSVTHICGCTVAHDVGSEGETRWQATMALLLERTDSRFWIETRDFAPLDLIRPFAEQVQQLGI